MILIYVDISGRKARECDSPAESTGKCSAESRAQELKVK